MIMNAAGILSDKGGDAFGVQSTASLQEAAQMLDEKKIGAVLVRDDDGQVCGVLSERDVARQVARKGADALDRPVTDCMSRKVITAHPNDTLDVLMTTMTDRRIRHLPVVENDKLCGMISIGDVVKYKIAEAEAEATAMHNYIAAG
jgi:CBS domain-containing protein